MDKLKGLLRQRGVWIAGAAGAGLGLLVYLRRRAAGSSNEGGGAQVVGSTIDPATLDSSGYNAYQNLQSELENLAGHVTALETIAGNNPSNPQGAMAPPPASSGATPGGVHYVMARGGHPVSYDYLKSTGYITGSPGRYRTTGKGGLPKGHPVSYAYLAGSHLIRRA